MAIKAIIFDCFGVLVMGGRQVLVQNYPNAKKELHDLAVRSDYGFMPRSEFLEELYKITGVSADEYEELYWGQNKRNQSAFEWMKELRESGLYKIGMLSNIGVGWLDDIIPEDERNILFDDVVLSGTVNLVKPDEKIFQLAVDRFGLEASECVMIDDILENVAAATAIGMKGIVYGTTTQARLELDRILGEVSA